MFANLIQFLFIQFNTSQIRSAGEGEASERQVSGKWAASERQVSGLCWDASWRWVPAVHAFTMTNRRAQWETVRERETERLRKTLRQILRQILRQTEAHSELEVNHRSRCDAAIGLYGFEMLAHRNRTHFGVSIRQRCVSPMPVDRPAYMPCIGFHASGCLTVGFRCA